MTWTSERRFVVLEHNTDPHHFDLMLEREDELWTWSYYDDRLPDDFDGLRLERIQDHRKTYLTYEGPVSDDRGRVRRVEEGTYQLHTSSTSDDHLTGRINGTRWSGPFQLRKTEETGPRDQEVWILTGHDRETE